MNKLKTVRSIGIDLSCTATGIIVLEEGDPNPATLLEIELVPKGLKGIERNAWIAQEVILLVDKYSPDRIVVEGYSLNMKNAASVIPLVELGSLVRFMLRLDGRSWYDPRAGEVKKFCTGKGNTQKDKVMMCVLKRWGFESLSNNTADAYVCAAMGLAHANRLKGATLEMRKITGAMKSVAN